MAFSRHIGRSLNIVLGFIFISLVAACDARGELALDEFAEDLMEVEETVFAPTLEPTPKPTPVPSPTTDPGQALREDEALRGSQLVLLDEVDIAGVVDPDGRFISNELEEGDPLLRSIPFFLVDPSGNLYLGFAGEQDGLAINLSTYFPGDAQGQPSGVFNFAQDEASATRFDTERLIFRDDPRVFPATKLLLASLGFDTSYLEDARDVSLWVYKLVFDEDGKPLGHKIVHFSLDGAKLAELVDLGSDLDDVDFEDLEESPFIVGKVFTYREGGLTEVTDVEVSEAEALEALDNAIRTEHVILTPDMVEAWEGYGEWVREEMD